jgi:hypothetical protein
MIPREFIKSLRDKDWDELRDKTSFLSGSEYKRVWKMLAG